MDLVFGLRIWSRRHRAGLPLLAGARSLTDVAVIQPRLHTAPGTTSWPPGPARISVMLLGLTKGQAVILPRRSAYPAGEENQGNAHVPPTLAPGKRRARPFWPQCQSPPVSRNSRQLSEPVMFSTQRQLWKLAAGRGKLSARRGRHGALFGSSTTGSPASWDLAGHHSPPANCTRRQRASGQVLDHGGPPGPRALGGDPHRVGLDRHINVLGQPITSVTCPRAARTSRPGS